MPVRRGQGQRYGGEDLSAHPEDVVPIVLRGTEALNGGVQRDHGLGHGVTEGIVIEAAVDLAALVQQGL
jgi:hypothetical protein